MSLRDAPLPRMAGHLSFMRARRVGLADLSADNLVVIGAPMETGVRRTSGFRYGPRALRETSVYFGWHANAQFSHPVDIDERAGIDTSSIHNRLVDLGDLALEGMSHECANERIESVMRAVNHSGAASIVLGGDSSIVAPIANAHSQRGGQLGLIQFGGSVPVSLPECYRLGAFIAPQEPQAREARARVIGAQRSARMNESDWKALVATIAHSQDALLVHVDLSVLQSALHGMADVPRQGGMTLPTLQTALLSIGQANVCCLVVSGINPTINAMSVVKTGQRLLVTALLGFIYARLGLLTS